MTESTRRVRIFIACYFLMLASPLIGQSLEEHRQKGERFYQRKDYKNALLHFEQALALDPDDAATNYKAGISSIDQKLFDQAVECLRKTYQSRPDFHPDLEYHLGVACQNAYHYADAARHFQNVKARNKALATIAGRKIAECLVADSLMKLTPTAKVVALDESLNTAFSEFAPLIAADGRSLIFTSDRSSDGYQVKSQMNLDDVYISNREGAGWTPPVKISTNINVKNSEVATFFSADGTRMLIYYEDGGGDIYQSIKENEQWARPTPLNKFINNPDYRETWASISPDGNRLFFSSNRPGGKGGFDIYVCERAANGDWGRPSNLGSMVNTRKDELSPFIHADGKTLYFSSNGHPTLGDHDVFRATLVNGKWGKPENLGHPVNSAAFDGFLSVTPDGRHGYFSSRRKAGNGDSDIFHATFQSGFVEVVAENVAPIESEQRLVTILHGFVTDLIDSRPLQATVTLVDNTSHRVIASVKTSGSGTFEIAIPRDGNFGLTTEAAGYLFHSMNVDDSAPGETDPLETNIGMVRAKVGSKVVLKNIFFDSNESTLRNESMAELRRVHELLVRNPAWRFRINGHTDNVGNADANRALSLKRAEAVVAYLVSQGIAPARLEAKGFGSERPLVSNDDEREGRQINRRTEIEIIE